MGREMNTPRLSVNSALHRLLLSAIIGCQFFLFVHGQSLTVVYPEVREPYASIYRDYIAGIRAAYSGPIDLYPINGELLQKLKDRVPRGSPPLYIALGNKSLNAIRSFDGDAPVIAAITKTNTDANLVGGVLMRPSAEVYLERLKDIYPKSQSVYVVYHPERQGALIEQAKQFSETNGLALNAFPAENLRQSADAYREILAEARKREAIWLLPDSSLLDKSLLSLLLDVAWDKSLLVFSSNPLFVKRGALFALYPDNRGIGRRLGAMAKNMAENGGQPGSVQYLRDVKLAYNERTGDHIGITLTPAVRKDVELLLPEL